MTTILRRIAATVLPGLAAVLVICAATAGADTPPPRVNPVVMGESVRHQLAGARVYQFAISVDGQLAVTGERGDASPADAVAALRNGAQGGDAVSCHARFGEIEAVLLVNAGATDTQPCGVLGVAYDAAA
jgi:hypothetical protein